MQTKFSHKHNLLIWSFFIIALVLLAYGLFRPTPPEEVFTHSDKAGHFIAFFTVSFLGKMALNAVPSSIYWGTWLILAGLLEYLQDILCPMRVFSLEDAYANGIGVCIAIIACYLISKRAPKP
ncbi:MAG: hypothetical protein CSA60_00610 [Neptuniibacter caesariensis]|uniref:VanZ-like domain-containing protein n=1 Tax=Neptuniibacter caesariensis TaxID=207954 RepID=A0A2G6JS62_NEPCE|nr:MAG: hypothetical protein CSA60_00610 [Neptuniibacter caesariensis]